MPNIEHMLKKKMTRRQFLLGIGVGVFSLFGLSTLMGIMAKPSGQGRSRPGYGRANYGP